MSDKRPNIEPARVQLPGQQRSPSQVAQHAGTVKPAANTGFARLARGLTLALEVIAGAAAASLPAAAGETPTEFVRILGSEALAEMRSYAPLDQKEAYFHQMLRQDFDLNGISQFVLGPYWRIASPEQRQEFRRLLEDYFMRTEGTRLAQSSGGDFRVTGSRASPGGVLVTGQIISPQGAPVEVDFQLGISDGRYKVDDVTIAGVSMALSYRSKIQSMIARNGGQVGTVLATLHEEG